MFILRAAFGIFLDFSFCCIFHFYKILLPNLVILAHLPSTVSMFADQHVKRSFKVTSTLPHPQRRWPVNGQWQTQMAVPTGPF